MAWMACRSCSTRFAVGLLRCPQCNAVSELFAVPDHVVEAEEENMPKITVADGASNALGTPDEPVADVAPEPEVVAEPEPTVPQEETLAATPADAAEDKPETPESPAAPAPKKRASRKSAPGAGPTAGA